MIIRPSEVRWIFSHNSFLFKYVLKSSNSKLNNYFYKRKGYENELFLEKQMLTILFFSSNMLLNFFEIYLKKNFRTQLILVQPYTRQKIPLPAEASSGVMVAQHPSMVSRGFWGPIG